MPRLLKHIRKFVVRGVLALIPVALVMLVVYLLYDFIDRRVVVLVDRTLHVNFPGLGIVILFLLLYLVGLVASNIFGQRLFDALAHLVERIPGIGTIYRIGKQLSGTLSETTNKELFRRPVLVPYAAPHQWQIGFVTGSIRAESTGEQLLKVFVPTPPNVATGLVYIVRESNVRDPGWTVEEALQCLMSGGIIGPEKMR